MLVGDQVDNVPGVQGVGPKTAVKLLQEYGSVDALMAQADQIKGAVGDKLRKALDWLPTGRQLLTIKTDCDLNGWVPHMPALDAIRMGEPQNEPLRSFYETYGFKGLAKALGGGETPTPAPAHSTGRHRRPVRRTGRRRAARQRTGLRHHPHLGSLRHLAGQSAGRRSGGRRHRNHLARRNGGADRRHQLQRDAREKPPTSRSSTKAQTRPSNCRWTRCSPGSSPGWRTRKSTSSASTSSTTATSSPTTASRCRATRTTPCCKAMCSKCTSRTASAASPSATWAAAASVTKTCAARARTRSRLPRWTVAKAAEYSCEDSDQTLDVHRVLWPQIEADAKLQIHLRTGNCQQRNRSTASNATAC